MGRQFNLGWHFGHRVARMNLQFLCFLLVRVKTVMPSNSEPLWKSALVTNTNIFYWLLIHAEQIKTKTPSTQSSDNP